MALYQPTNIVPDVRSGIGEGTVDVTQGMKVTWCINGASAMVAFSIVIMSNNASSTQLYTTGKITDGCPAYGTSSNGTPVPFSYTIPATALSTAGITNGNEYKLLITQWWSDNDSITQSSASVFITRNEPTLAITPIVTQAEITDLQTSIVPIQSGTGDPYPAGGGTNLFDGVTELGGISSANGENQPSTTTLRSTNYIPIPNGQQIYLGIYKAGQSGASLVYLFYYAQDKTYLSSSGAWQASGVKTPPTGAYYLRLQLHSSYGTTYTNDIAINYPSTEHDYSPYSNIRPISGWTGAELYRTGKNLWMPIVGTNNSIIFEQQADGGIHIHGTALNTSWTYVATGRQPLSYFGFVVGEKYTEKVNTGGRISIEFYDAANTTISSNSTTAAVTSLTVTVPSAATKAQLVLYAGTTRLSAGDVIDFVAYPRLEIGNTAGDFVAYNGTTYTASWQSEAGTVYKASLDWTRKKLTVTHAMVNCDGSEYWNSISGTSTVPQRYTRATGLSLVANKLLSNEFSIAYSNTGTFGQARIFADGTIAALDSEKHFENATAFRTWLGSNPAQFLVQLATPIEYDLTDVDDVTLLLKKNNIWCDTGAVDATVELVGHSTEYTGDIIEVFGGDTAIFTRCSSRSFRSSWAALDFLRVLHSFWHICGRRLVGFRCGSATL